MSAFTRARSPNGNAQISGSNHSRFAARGAALPKLEAPAEDKTGSPRAAAISLNQFLNRWLATLTRPKLRATTLCDHETLLRLYIRPALGTRLFGAVGQIHMQEPCAPLFERGLSARTIECTNALLESALRQPVRWRMLAKAPAPASICLGRSARRWMRSVSRSAAGFWRSLRNRSGMRRLR